MDPDKLSQNNEESDDAGEWKADGEMEEVDEAAELKEKDRMNELKKCKSSYVRNLHKGEVKEKKKKDIEQQMKDLINQAEKYASFLLSKHKMNSKG